ncbi:MAG: type IX secretion system outer membrane channel protein PorV [Chitinophagales bacterium]
MYFSSRRLAAVVLTTVTAVSSFAQSSDKVTFNPNLINTVTTALPFLRIVNDTRSGGMGDVGIAIDPDANGAQLNGAKMAFIDKDYGFGLSFTPWLKQLVNDIYLAQFTGYYRIKKVQTIHVGFRYFSLGNIQFTNDQGDPTIQVRPNELAVDAGYARRLGKIVSVGLTLRFAYSNIAPGGIPGPGGEVIKPALAGAADISVMVNKTFTSKTNPMTHELKFGLCFSNLGNKVTYSANNVKDYIPANLGIGLGYVLNVDKNNSIGIYADFNKLLVPTPIPRDYYLDKAGNKRPQYFAENDPNVLDYREWSSVKAIFKSFADAPGGAKEEFREITTGIGAEYWFRKMFAVRAGYFYEHPTKGNRQFVSVGASVKYSVAGLHLSYLVPTSNLRNPLDNTFRLSLTFDFTKGQFAKKADDGAVQGSSVVPVAEPVQKSRRAKNISGSQKADPVGSDPNGTVEPPIPTKE